MAEALKPALPAACASRLTPRERFIAALERRPLPGRVPHFELVFYLTVEAFGKLHFSQRHYGQWLQMTETERDLHRREMADLYLLTAERYEHDAILLHPNPGSEDEIFRLIDGLRERSGPRYALLLHGDATSSVPHGNRMTDYACRLFEEPDAVKDESERRVDDALARAKRLRAHGGLDGFALCSDYCFNSGPFLKPEMFGEFITPYLKRLVAGYRELGFYTIKHTDGNIMPILDDLLDAKPHALHSLDPQGGVDMAEMVRLAADRVCLIGNVNCGLLDTGTEDACRESARYALRHGLRAPGYVFSTSNCIYTGMRLERYELILDVWRREGIRTAAKRQEDAA
ncbi:MAG: uroporphyrinogen decarboxylase family protein [Planctomycetota bacterium]|nr:uroporphyrinogen decarboxylase family protein [Planctomycetota bacterium]